MLQLIEEPLKSKRNTFCLVVALRRHLVHCLQNIIQSTAWGIIQSTAWGIIQSTAWGIIQSTAWGIIQSTAWGIIHIRTYRLIGEPTNTVK